MIIVFALTQFVLLTLGTIFLKGMVNANGDITSSLYFQFLDQNWIWFFLLPVAWTAYAHVSYKLNKGPFTPAVARILWDSSFRVLPPFLCQRDVFPVRLA